MEAILITYDLNLKPNGSYTAIKEKIRTMFTEERRFEELLSTFIVYTEMSSLEIFDVLKPYLESNDKLLVLTLEYEGNWFGISEKGIKFLQSHFR